MQHFFSRFKNKKWPSFVYEIFYNSFTDLVIEPIQRRKMSELTLQHRLIFNINLLEKLKVETTMDE